MAVPPLGLPGGGGRALSTTGDRAGGRVLPNAEIIPQSDIDPSSISKELSRWTSDRGDCKRVLRRLIERCGRSSRDGVPAAVTEGRRQSGRPARGLEARLSARYDWDDEVIKPQYVIQELSEA